MEDSSKRVIIAFALSFAILMAWRVLFPPPAEPPAKTSGPAQAPAARPKPGAPPASASPTDSTKPSPATAAPSAPATLGVQMGSKAEEIIIENDVARITFSTEGAVVKSWVLKKYKGEKGQPLDIVNAAACRTLGFPLSLRLEDQELAKILNSALYAATQANPKHSVPGKLEMVFSDGKVQARKVFSFAAGYEVHAEVSVSDGRRHLPVEVAWPGGLGDHSLPHDRTLGADRVVYRNPGDGKLHVESLTPSFFGNLFSKEPDPSEKRLDIPGPLILAGLGDRYFAGVFFPESPDLTFRVERLAWTPPDWKGEESERPAPLSAWVGSSASKPLSIRLFVGPKELDLLRTTNPPVDGLVDFGWFSFVARPLFLGMHYIHDHWTNNYGWAIVLLTIFINIAFFPVKLKQIRSAQEMQRVAPIVKGIQDKYKDYKFNDPRKQRAQQEIMKVYKEHGINPLGGCLPMLIQLPFFYGFYQVLDLSIELRHAPWMLWIRDLSARDPYYILPVLMTVTMFLLQRMTPMTVADPAQQRMFMLMPLVMGFMFINFASGLVLYWLTGNVVGIAQQVIMNKFLKKRAQVAAPVPRKAAAKEK